MNSEINSDKKQPLPHFPIKPRKRIDTKIIKSHFLPSWLIFNLNHMHNKVKKKKAKKRKAEKNKRKSGGNKYKIAFSFNLTGLRQLPRGKGGENCLSIFKWRHKKTAAFTRDR